MLGIALYLRAKGFQDPKEFMLIVIKKDWLARLLGLVCIVLAILIAFTFFSWKYREAIENHSFMYDTRLIYVPLLLTLPGLVF